MSNLNQILSTNFVFSLTLPDILCWLAVIPFVIMIVVFWMDCNHFVEPPIYKIYTICSVIQLLLFMIASTIWMLIESRLHYGVILCIIWFIVSLRNACEWKMEMD